jgi:Tol biopolymer transport system component
MGEWMRTAVRRTGLTFVAAGGALNGISCSGEDVTSPTTGSLEITTATSGPDPDGDGYAVAIDGGAEAALGVNATLHRNDLEPGSHSVRLSGVAGHCTVAGDNPRTITIAAGGSATVAFSITCPAQQRPRIAFTSSRDGNSEIYLMNPDGTGLTRLTNTPENESDPAWSPDGRRIAFARYPDVFVMNADGTGQTNLTNGAAWDFSPTWSPDGTKIAFIREANPPGAPSFSEVMVMNADGSDVTQLSHTNGIYTSAEWSRDGAMIAFTAYTDSPSFIGFVLADGSREVLIAGGGDESARDPTWSSGGKIAFSVTPYVFGEGNEHYPEDYDIYVMNGDGTGRVQLTTDLEFDDLDPAWSRDDRKIAFVRYSSGHSDIYVMNADGTGQSRLTDHPASDYDPSWSP